MLVNPRRTSLPPAFGDQDYCCEAFAACWQQQQHPPAAPSMRPIVYNGRSRYHLMPSMLRPSTCNPSSWALLIPKELHSRKSCKEEFRNTNSDPYGSHSIRSVEGPIAREFPFRLPDTRKINMDREDNGGSAPPLARRLYGVKPHVALTNDLRREALKSRRNRSIPST